MNIELFALAKFGWLAVAPWLLYVKQKNDKLLESIINKLAQTPTYDEVEKEIVKAVSPIRDDQKEMLVMVREMNSTLNTLARDLAVANVKLSINNKE